MKTKQYLVVVLLGYELTHVLYFFFRRVFSSVEPLKSPFSDWRRLHSAMDINEFVDVLPIFGAVILVAWIVSLHWRNLR